MAFPVPAFVPPRPCLLRPPSSLGSVRAVRRPALPAARPLRRAVFASATPPSPVPDAGGEDAGGTPPPTQRTVRLPVTNDSPVTGRRLVRNTPDTAAAQRKPEGETFATPRAGEAGGPQVGEGLSSRKRVPVAEKKVTKAAAAQGSMGFADAWASQNRDRGGSRFDIWAFIGLLFILTPFVILVVAVATGVIPTGGLFE